MIQNVDFKSGKGYGGARRIMAQIRDKFDAQFQKQ
jgi:hypothetical protein